jgi:flagellar biosynthesis/type III secretory pathway protein FliH
MRFIGAQSGLRVVPRAVGDALQQVVAIKDAAQQEAAKIIQDAHVEAAQIRAVAAAEGAHVGRCEAIAQLAEVRSKIVVEDRITEGQIVSLALDVARLVLDREARVDKQMVAEIARKALSRVRRAQSIVLRVHPGDAQEAQARVREWIVAGAETTLLEVVGDESIALGSVRVECELGVIDASLSAQLAAIARVFTGETQ